MEGGDSPFGRRWRDEIAGDRGDDLETAVAETLDVARRALLDREVQPSPAVRRFLDVPAHGLEDDLVPPPLPVVARVGWSRRAKWSTRVAVAAAVVVAVGAGALTTLQRSELDRQQDTDLAVTAPTLATTTTGASAPTPPVVVTPPPSSAPPISASGGSRPPEVPVTSATVPPLVTDPPQTTAPVPGTTSRPRATPPSTRPPTRPPTTAKPPSTTRPAPTTTRPAPTTTRPAPTTSPPTTGDDLLDYYRADAARRACVRAHKGLGAAELRSVCGPEPVPPERLIAYWQAQTQWSACVQDMLAQGKDQARIKKKCGDRPRMADFGVVPNPYRPR